MPEWSHLFFGITGSKWVELTDYIPCNSSSETFSSQMDGNVSTTNMDNCVENVDSL